MAIVRFVRWVLFVLLSVEIFSRLFLSTDFARELLAREAARGDTSSRILWNASARVQASRRRVPDRIGLLQYHPLRGWALKPNLSIPRAVRQYAVTTNGAGLRGARDYVPGPLERGVRIAVMGDSFTFGEGVDDNETYSFLLEQSLPQVEVLNCGVPGYGHDQMLLYLQEILEQYRPHIVLIGFVSCDIGRNLLSFRDYAKPRFLLRNATLQLGEALVPSPEQLRRAELFSLRSRDLLSVLCDVLRQKTGITTRKAEALSTALLDEMLRVSSARGAKPILVYLPIGAEMNDPVDHRFMREYCVGRRLDFVSVKPAFLAAKKKGIGLKTGGHWSAREHRLAAEEIGAYLTQNKMFVNR